MPMKYTWHTDIGPYYRCVDEDNNAVIDVHQDQAGHGWRCSYPDGRSNLHTSIYGARRETEEYMKGLGYDHDLQTLIRP